MSTLTIVIIIAVVVIGGSLAIWYFFFSEHAEKKKLVDQIIALHKNDASFDADPSKLMDQDITTLQGILNGTIH